MRIWKAFATLLTILALILPADITLAASSKDGKKNTAQSQTQTKKGSATAKQAKSGGAKQSTPAKSSDSKAKHGGKKSTRKEAKHSKAQAPELKAPVKTIAQPDSNKGEFGVDTKAALVMDIETGHILFAQEPDLTIPPASLTKVLTLYILNELIQSGSIKPEQVISVSQEASHAGGSTMRLRTGEQVTLDELMKGIAVASANDGCVAVAEYLGKGDTHPFVEAMNSKAKEIGMANSQFFNPNGLPADGQVTTARDMALLAQAYLKRFPQTLAVHSMTEFTHNNRVRHNSNSLLGKVEGVDGLKTGFVCASGFNIVVTARRGDTRLVAVVLGAKNRRIREREATRLIEEGFKIVAAQKQLEVKHVAMNPGASTPQ
ncbi:serine hydrolase [Fundidesulfovibrio agrisoli]|uniref:serine hydrolase n=1 Tax=Fundidesulfovibrio agrisoli TaxID=2922717 RepID=UPI001FABA357|nr:serine hydrolase [Fundidesulfovibrio agrisoli]